jgi:hypothetical protein
MGLPKRLTEMQKRFAELLVFGGPDGPLTKSERLKKYEVNYDTHVAELGRIKDAALKKGAWSAAVNAETNRGKAAGLYIDRKIIKTGKLEDLTEQELEAKMKQILDDYSQIIDVTPDTKKITE